MNWIAFLDCNYYYYNYYYFFLALSQYYHALLHLRTVGGLQPENNLKERSNEQLVKVYNNMAGKVQYTHIYIFF